MIAEKTKTVSKVAGQDDNSLITSFCDGNNLAFDRLVLKYQDQIVGLCIRYLGNRADGEDAAQETFVKVYKNLTRFKGESLFSTWLYRIALNTCKNHGRSWWSRLTKKAQRLDAPVETENDRYVPEIGDERLSPEKDLERRSTAQAISTALAQLPPLHKEILLLRDIQDHSYEEISVTLKISLGTVKSRLVRARAAMQEKLRGTFYG